MTESPGRELRIGDSERTTAADELAEHYAQGRLTTEEHHERLDRVWEARTPSELSAVFTDLPGSAYRMPSTYATAEVSGVGSDRPRTKRPFAGPPFGRPPIARPPFGRPPYGGRDLSKRFGLLPVVVRVALIVLLAVLVIAHLPLILLGLVIWLVLTHKFRHAHAYHRRW